MGPDDLRLFPRNPGEPLPEIPDRGSLLRILEQGAHRHAGALEHPSPVHDIIMPFRGPALAPFKRSGTLFRNGKTAHQ